MKKRLYTIITGAGQGLGKALAVECARRRMNLILVSLPGEGLEDMGLQLQASYQVHVIAIEKDLCMEGACANLFKEIVALNAGINMLINNAGTGNTEFFKDGRLLDYDRQIRLNVLATTLLTHLFIDMLAGNGPSYVLNVGSLASFFSLEKKQVYGATKSYVSYFSKSLRRELKNENVFVSVLCPGGMHTNQRASETINTGSYITRASAMDPHAVALIAIKGLLQKKELIIPGKINRSIVFLNRILPRFVVRFFETRTMKRLHNPIEQRSRYEQRPVPVFSKILVK